MILPNFGRVSYGENAPLNKNINELVAKTLPWWLLSPNGKMWYNGIMVKANNNTVVEWDGQEYVTHDKNTGWYVGLVVVGLALVAVSILLKWWSFTVLVVVSVIALFVYAMRPPRKIHYVLSKDGLREGNGRTYKFEDYKSFGILQDDKRFAIVLRPTKRFSSSVTVYFPEERGEEIVDMFGARLPMEEVKLDFIDKIIKILRI